MIRMKELLLIFLLTISLTFAAFPKPVGYVNDFAGILADTETLEQEVAAYEKNTTVEIAVVTLDSLPEDQALATYAVELFQEWGIGKKGEDNGILVILVKDGAAGNRMRIELGYGIQGYITGAEAGRMLDRALPFYEQDDYQLAVESILTDISDELENYVPGTVVKRNDGFPGDYLIWQLVLSNLPVIIFIGFIVLAAGMSSRCPYCFGKLKSHGDYYTCTKCGRRVSKRRRFAPILVGGGGHGGFAGGGGGGFGGGSSGGGGAGR